MNAISRLRFLGHLGQGAAFLTMTEINLFCAGSSVRDFGDPRPSPGSRADRLGVKTPILRAILAGASAPSAHNTQPWKFAIQNDQEALLYVDENRLLLETDPPARQIHISQGTFLEHLSLGAEADGFAARIKLFPQGAYDHRRIGKSPVARIKLTRDDSVRVDSLFRWIPVRATNRAVYEGPLLTDREIETIERLVRPEHARLRFINTPGRMKPFFKLFYRAFAVETNTPAKHDESRRWFRYNDHEIRKQRDGISLRGNGVSGLRLWLAEKFFLPPGKKAWHEKSNRDAGLDMFRKAIFSSRGLVFLSSPGNSPEDWVRAGREYARLQLAATSLGLVMQPISQALQEYPEMKEIRERCDQLAGVSGARRIQMIARLGRSDYRYFSPRRALKSMIQSDRRSTPAENSL